MYASKIDAGIMRRRNERNGMLTVLTTCDMESLHALAAERGARSNTAELGFEELVQIFRGTASAHALALAAGVCRLWRAAACHLRRDILWQLENLAVINGVPEPFLMPHTAEELKLFVRSRPQEAVALLSIKQLREAGAEQSLVAERLDHDDGISFCIAASCDVETRCPVPEETRDSVKADRIRLEKQLRQSGDGDGELPIKCTLEADPDGTVCIMVGDRHVGFVPSSYVPIVALGEARITHMRWGGGHYKARALPR